jgi:hypothetical protein
LTTLTREPSGRSSHSGGRGVFSGIA